MKIAAAVWIAAALSGCALSPSKVAGLIADPVTQGATSTADVALSGILPQIAHVNDAANAVAQAARDISDQRKQNPSGPAPDAPLSSGDWVKLGLAGVGTLLGYDKYRNSRYVAAGQAKS